MDSCQCVGYGISALVLLGLSVVFLGINVYLARRRPLRGLEAPLTSVL